MWEMNFILLTVFAVLMVLRAWVLVKYQEELYPKWYYGMASIAIVIGFYWVLYLWSREYIISAIMVAGIAVVDLIGVLFIMSLERKITRKRRN